MENKNTKLENAPRSMQRWKDSAKGIIILKMILKKTRVIEDVMNEEINPEILITNPAPFVRKKAIKNAIITRWHAGIIQPVRNIKVLIRTETIKLTKKILR